MLRFLRYTIEYIAAFVGFVVLLVVLLAWRLSASPLSSDFMTPYIEDGIESLVPGSNVHVASTLLTWDNMDRSVSLHTENIKISNVSGNEIAAIPSLDARISVLGLLFGQFLPKYLHIDHPQIKIERNKTGAFVFGGMEVADTDAPPDPRAQPIKDILRHISENLSHAALMHKLAVTQAVFDVHDDVTHKDWAVAVPEISITRTLLRDVDHRLEYGALDGRMTVEVTQKDAPATLDVHYVYDPTELRHTLSTEFTNLTPAYLAGGHPETLGLAVAAIVDLPLTGKARATFDKALDIEDASTRIHGDAGQLVYADFWDKPCPVKSADLQADYDRDARKLTVSDTRVDFDGPTLALTVDGGAPSKPGQDLDFTLGLQVDNMPMNSYGALWPKSILPDPRYWLDANLRDGTFNHAEATLKGSLAWNDLGNLSIDDGGGKLSATGARVTYLDGMPPATGVNANATFDLKKMSVQVTSGGVGAIRLRPFTIQVLGLDATDQTIEIPLQVGGPVPDVLRLLDNPPLGYAKKLGIAPDDIAGSIQGTVNFKFPLLKTLEMKDVSIDAAADSTGIASTQLVPGLAIDQGNLAMVMNMSGFNLKGQASLNKVPFQITFLQNFEAGPGKPLQQVDVVGPIREDQWEGFGVKTFKGSKGPIGVTFRMVRPTHKLTQFSGTLDMTAAAVQIDALGWKKAAAVPAIMKFTANAPLGQPLAVTNLDLHGDQISVQGTASLSPDMSQLFSLNMSPMIVGRSNANLTFTQTFGPGGSLRFDATGKSLDISGLRGNSKGDSDKADTRPQEYHIKVDRFYTGANGEVDMAQGSAVRDASGWSAIDLRGIVGDNQPLSIELTPQPDGHRTLNIDFANFGDAMRGLGFTDTVKGGKLSVTGQSTVDSPRRIDGNANITAFEVDHLPALALLLNATSPFGFKDIITDSANFSRFEGAFQWEGDSLTLTKAHAAGSAIGINIDGKIDMNGGDADLQGTLVPFSVVNKVLNYIPILGNIITGGEDQGVLAVAYTIKGPLSSPQVSVNPISLLTPGFLRNLFFRDDKDDNSSSGN